MKVYVKKDKVLKLLGEGKVFSKKELMLKEDEKLSLTADEEDGAEPVGNAVQKGVSELDSIGKDASYEIKPQNVAGGRVKPQTTVSNGAPLTPTVTVNKNDPNLVNIVKTNTANGTGVKIQDVRGSVNSSVTPRKVMDEMRANSIPFTKSELTKFLKSL